MTRFQFKPESGKKQKRFDKRIKERDESGYDDRFPKERYSPEGKRGEIATRGAKGAAGSRGGPKGRAQRPGSKPAGPAPRVKAAGGPRTALAERPVRDEFSALIRQTAGDLGLAPQLDPEPAPLALLDYKTELDLKNATIRAWWAHHAIPDKPSLVVASPLPRHYRSTSKRRLIRKGETWRYDFFLERLGGVAKAGIDVLEPATHEAIYKFAIDKLNEPAYRALANSINFLIVRGDAEQMVIFNVFRLGAEVVRKAKMLGEHLAKLTGATVIAAHVFYDKTRSDYYIESRVSEGAFRLKRLFGPEFLPITVEGRRFLLHPTGFFQVNTSILPRVIAEVHNALKPQKTDRLLDLYCGCGLFTLPVAADCAEAYGIEGSPVSIEAAKKAAGSASQRNTRFTAGRIDAKTLTKMLPAMDGTPEILLLDPPRQGTAPGVIPLLAERKPRRVAYLFCDMNVMPVEINKWRKQGYMVAKALPFDMFPGTNNLEMLVVLIPDKFGLLGRKKPKVDPVDEVEEEKARPAKRMPPKKTGYTPKNKR
jgi:tRNA/tmRNA/rRNA uracil-C5-methylase (TrmA/RlmC/RlmD family)